MASDPTAGGAPAEMPVDSPEPNLDTLPPEGAWKAAAGREGRAAGQASCARSPRRRTCAAAPSRTSRSERKFGIERFARDVLSVADNLGRALSALPAMPMLDPAVQNVIVGVQATERELQSVLERHGVTRIEAIGKPFNAEFHQAMMEVEDPTVPAGTVVQELIPGYLLAGRLLRAAMVGVSKGGPPRTERRRSQANERLSARQRRRVQGTVTRRRVRLIRPPSGRSWLVPGRMRSTPWNQSRDGPSRIIRSPLPSRNDRVGLLRSGPPSRNSAVSPSEIDRMGASLASSSSSRCNPSFAVGP